MSRIIEFNTEDDVDVKIQKTLVAINDITLKIKKELELIEELVKENGHLHTAVNTANETLSRKVEKMGINLEQIMNKIKDGERLELDLLGTITSSQITESLLGQIDAL
ncbi:uncharacterized protein LOC116840455 [Odontomachus brunneus]|uniref:uncharacterized protein LOC116840455 n=1 Tax=Odontomachus brunneus TaxID=486640 RepID=UPI0013F23791|nr:uncharacterized protein LOC116840455 [Odontomachus brunneus]